MDSQPAPPRQDILFPEENVADADEVEFWKGVERRLRDFCDPLSIVARKKNVCWVAQRKESQLSKELSGTGGKHLSAVVLLYLARKTQHEELSRFLICDVLGFKMPERQDARALSEELGDARAEIARLKGMMRTALGEVPTPVAPLLRVRP